MTLVLNSLWYDQATTFLLCRGFNKHFFINRKLAHSGMFEPLPSLLFSNFLLLSNSNLERRFLPNNISAGDRPVVVCGVILYWNRNLAIRSL